MKRYGERMEETRMVKKILRSLQKKFYYMVVAIEESQNMNFLSIQGLMGKLQAHEERVNEIQEDVGAQAPFSKQDGYGYSQGGRGRGRFGRGGRDSLNKSNSQPNKENWSISSTSSNNSRSRFDSRFDKSKVKCYNCQKTSHYAKNYWILIKRVEENANLMIEEENKATLLLVPNEKI
jgi:hypothetical protein